MRTLLRVCCVLAFSTMLGLVGCSEDNPVQPPTTKPLVTGPGSIHFGDVRFGDCKDTTIRYDNTTGKTVTLTRASFSSAQYSWVGASFPLELVAGTSVDLKVRYCPDLADSNHSYVVLTGTGGDSVKIQLHGISRKPLLTGPDVTDFGTVAVGACKDTSVAFTNLSSKAVTLTSISFGSEAFTAVGLSLPVEVAAGSVVNVAVRFCPSTPDSVSTAMVVRGASNDSSKFTLTGRGVIAEPGAGSRFTYLVDSVDGEGKIVGGHQSTLLNLIVSTGTSYQGKNNVFVVQDGSDQYRYQRESNGDLSRFLARWETGFMNTWITLPYGSKKRNQVLYTFDTAIATQQGPSVNLSIRMVASYIGTRTMTVQGTVFTVEDVELTTTMDFKLANVIPLGSATRTTSGGYIRSLGYLGTFTDYWTVRSLVPDFELPFTPGGSTRTLISYDLQ